MDYLIIFLGVILFIYIEKRFNLLGKHLSNDPVQLTLSFGGLVNTHHWFRDLAGVTEKELDDDKNKKAKKKWYKFFEENESNFDNNSIFNLTFEPLTKMFYIQNINSHTQAIPLKWGDNTDLFNAVLRYFPYEDDDLKDPHIELSVVYREHKYITVGLRKHKEKYMGGTEYVKLFDFPINFLSSSVFLKNEEYKKYGFEFKADFIGPYDDDFGKTQGMTLSEYVHKKGSMYCNIRVWD